MKSRSKLFLWLTALAAFGACGAGTALGQAPETPPLPLPQRIPAASRPPAAQPPATPPATESEMVQPTAQPAPGERDKTIGNLVLVDESAQQVLKLIETLSNKPIIRAQNLPAVKISFDSRGPMTKQEALIALESLLSLNGIALTPMGNSFIKAVTYQDIARQAPEFIEGNARDYPPSEKFYTMLLKLKYLSVSGKEYELIIQPLMSPNPIGNVVPLPKANSLLLTDTLINLQRVEEVLNNADEPQSMGEEVLFYPLRNMQARDLQARLQSLLLNQNSALSKYFLNNTTIEADERTNQLIVLTHPTNVPMLNTIIDSFDIDVEPQTSSEVFYIKHAQAVEVQTLLDAVVSGQQETREEEPENAVGKNGGGQPGGGGGDAPAAPTPPQPSAISQAADNLDSGNLQFSKYITIVADERSNAVVVYGTKTDIKQIGELIDKIDVVLAQVMIEVIIAEVTLDKDEVSGLSSLGLSSDGGGWKGASISTNTPSIADTPAFDITMSTDLKTFNVAFGPAMAEGKLRVLQAPVLATTHNQEASVNVSESRPFLTGSTTSQVNPDATTTTVQYRDVGIQLTVKPLIGSNGVVQMEIEQIVENFIPDSSVTINGVPQQAIAKREATSFVSVTDQQVIVLAGLQESSISRSNQSVFLLGDIPILGELFKPETNNDARRELMIFIKPNVIYTQTDATRIANRTIHNLDNGARVQDYLNNPDMSEIYDKEIYEPPTEPVQRVQKNYGPNR
ncbi:MAG: secretin N-terminal domain-containing protein [Verrucomicrobiota bacterium JB024]|nr:secretin N-terminal domain-containing protein [Verrucomicrobiota bacterium JB024]